MFRLLFWIVLIVVAVWLWRRLKKPSTTPTAAPMAMVRCAHCNVHVPQSAALPHDDQWYCSSAHLEQGPRSREQ